MQQRCAAAVTALANQGLPRKVLLNVSKRNATRPVYLPAVIIGQIDRPNGLPANSNATIPDPFYAALGGDNRLLQCSVLHIVSIVEGGEGTLPEDAASAVEQALGSIKPNDWFNYAPGTPSCQATLGMKSHHSIVFVSFAFLQ